MRQKTASQPAMMRIAIAGGGGLAYILAQQISQSANAVLVLSRNVGQVLGLKKKGGSSTNNQRY